MAPIAPIGWYRDGCCQTDEADLGRHVACAVMTGKFLEFTRSRGNDLSTPASQPGLPGFKPGDRWCLWTTLRHTPLIPWHKSLPKPVEITGQGAA